MPEPFGSTRFPGHSTSSKVRVTKHPLDWGNIKDLGDPTKEHLRLLGNRIHHCAWFLNPLFTVHAPSPSPEFFQAVYAARSQWLRTSRQVLGNSGQRREARQAEHRGRLTAYLEITHPESDGLNPTRPPESSPFAGLTQEQRNQILSVGKAAKQLAFTGILLINGNLIPPHIWEAMANQLRHPDDTPLINVTRRRVDFSSLISTGDPQPLKAISQAELRSQLTRNPTMALYVCPAITVSAPCGTPAFLNKTRNAESEWHHLTHRALGKARKQLARSADWPTRLLVYNGTLVINQKCYIPGCWPDQRPSNTKLRSKPFESPTVPLSFLGLDSPELSDGNNQPEPTKYSNPARGTA